MKIAFAILLIVISLSACSRRVEYSYAQHPLSPDALNINTATVDELEKLPHVGRKTAEAIVEYRTVNGPFRRTEDVLLIRGISETRFAELRPSIRVE